MPNPALHELCGCAETGISWASTAVSGKLTGAAEEKQMQTHRGPKRASRSK